MRFSILCDEGRNMWNTKCTEIYNESSESEPSERKEAAREKAAQGEAEREAAGGMCEDGAVTQSKKLKKSVEV